MLIFTMLVFALGLGAIYTLDEGSRPHWRNCLAIAMCGGSGIGYVLGNTSLETMLIYLPWSLVFGVAAHLMMQTSAEETETAYEGTYPHDKIPQVIMQVSGEKAMPG
jgi:hypothetical protein